MPPFWHYEYVVWSGGRHPFGSLVWNMLDGDNGQVDAASFTTSHPAHQDTTYDSYELMYGEVREFEGQRVPWAWEVSATKGDESLRYRASVRQPLAMDPRGAGFLADFLLDCEGTYHGPDGETPDTRAWTQRVPRHLSQPGGRSDRRLTDAGGPHDHNHSPCARDAPRRRTRRRRGNVGDRGSARCRHDGNGNAAERRRPRFEGRARAGDVQPRQTGARTSTTRGPAPSA